VLVAKAANQSAGKSILPFLKEQLNFGYFQEKLSPPFYISSGFM
jgi:hypothetical protein